MFHQVLKVCCNHFLSKNLELQTLASSDRSWIWSAQDYSEGTLTSELFAIKFKTVDEVNITNVNYNDTEFLNFLFLCL